MDNKIDSIYYGIPNNAYTTPIYIFFKQILHSKFSWSKMMTGRYTRYSSVEFFRKRLSNIMTS